MKENRDVTGDDGLRALVEAHALSGYDPYAFKDVSGNESGLHSLPSICYTFRPSAPPGPISFSDSGAMVPRPAQVKDTEKFTFPPEGAVYATVHERHDALIKALNAYTGALGLT